MPRKVTPKRKPSRVKVVDKQKTGYGISHTKTKTPSPKKKPKKDTIKVGESEILVTPKGGGVSFIFDENLYELSMTLADLVDSLGEYTVEQAKKNKKII